MVSSCIDQLYDLNKGISMDMELGGDSLAIPIGSTDTIKLINYLDATTSEMLKIMEDGGYAVTMSGSIEPTIPAIPQENLKIDDQVKSLSTPIDFGDINLDKFKIPGIAVDKTVNMGLSTYSLGNFAIPSISKSTTTNAGMSDYALKTPSIADIDISANQYNILTGITLPPDPGGGPVELPIQDPDPVGVHTTSNIDYSVSVPDGVKNISDVELKNGAVFEVTIELGGAASTLSSGTLIPSFTINPADLFIFTNPPAGNVITFTTADSMTKANGYKVTKILPISKLNLNGNPIAGKLAITKNIAADGTMSLKNAKVMSDKLTQVGDMDMLVSVAVKNVEISSMEFDIPSLKVDIPSNSTSLNINNSIPDQIKKLNKIEFEDPATITIQLATEDLPAMVNSSIMLENLAINFPSQFVFEPQAGLSNNVYTITNEEFKPSEGRKIQLKLKELNMSDISVTNGVLKWNGLISYSGKVSFDGRINSKNIPSAGSDAKMNVQFGSSITFKSAEVVTNPIAVSIPSVSIPIKFDIDMPSQVKSLGVIKMKEGTQIRLDIQKPEMPLNFVANNIQVSFPSMFSFAPSSALLNNTLTLNGPMPDSVVLVLDALKINQNLVGGKLSLDENIAMSGGVELQSGVVNSKEIESLTGKNMSVKASTSDLSISSTSIQLNDLAFPYKDSIPLNFNIPNIPSQLLSLDSVLLKDNATIQLAVNITNMPDFGSPINVDLTIDFPDMFLFSPGSVNNKNQMIIHEAIVDGKLNKTIGIHGLKFDGKDLNGVLTIDKQLKYDASVSVNSPVVNSDDLVGKVINIGIDAKISNIAFKSVYGKLDPGMDPITKDISLSSLTDQLKANNVDVVLDVTKPVIVIKTECNLGIPINANVDVIPLRGSTPDANITRTFTLNLPKAPTAQDLLQRTFWISPDSAGMPAGSEYKKTEIQDLFKQIPDGVRMNATVTTDRSMQHYIDLTATYKFKLDYEVTVPFAFGEELSIRISKDIVGLDPKIGEMASIVGGIELLGNVYNSIPLELNLAAVPLNADGNPLALDTIKQVINAGAHDGSANASPLTLKLADKDDQLKNLRGFRLIFSASSNETVAGTPIKTSNFVKADLKVRVDGGINIEKLSNNKGE
jgi:hypothetical protein